MANFACCLEGIANLSFFESQRVKRNVSLLHNTEFFILLSDRELCHLAKHCTLTKLKCGETLANVPFAIVTSGELGISTLVSIVAEKSMKGRSKTNANPSEQHIPRYRMKEVLCQKKAGDWFGNPSRSLRDKEFTKGSEVLALTTVRAIVKSNVLVITYNALSHFLRHSDDKNLVHRALTTDILSHLKALPFLRSATPAQRCSIAELFCFKALDKGEILFHEGDDAKSLYLVVEGTLDILVHVEDKEEDGEFATCLEDSRSTFDDRCKSEGSVHRFLSMSHKIVDISSVYVASALLECERSPDSNNQLQMSLAESVHGSQPAQQDGNASIGTDLPDAVQNKRRKEDNYNADGTEANQGRASVDDGQKGCDRDQKEGQVSNPNTDQIPSQARLSNSASSGIGKPGTKVNADQSKCSKSDPLYEENTEIPQAVDLEEPGVNHSISKNTQDDLAVKTTSIIVQMQANDGSFEYKQPDTSIVEQSKGIDEAKHHRKFSEYAVDEYRKQLSKNDLASKSSEDSQVDVSFSDMPDIVAQAGEPIRLVKRGKGCFVGEIALMVRMPRSATVVARERTMLLQLDREHLQNFFQIVPELKTELERHIKPKLISKLQALDPPFMTYLRDEHLDELHTICKIEECKSGNTIIKQGTLSSVFYIVLYGALEATSETKQNCSKYELTAGSYFGEVGVLFNEKNKTSVKVKSKQAVLLKIEKDDFLRFFSKSPEVLAEFEIKVLGEDVGLNEVLQHPLARGLLYKFLEREHSTESLRFLFAVNELKQLTDPQDVDEMTTQVIEDHFLKSAPYSINIPSKICTRTMKLYNEGERGFELFTQAECNVHKLMELDSFSRFKWCDMFKLLLEHVGRPLSTSTENVMKQEQDASRAIVNAAIIEYHK